MLEIAQIHFHATAAIGIHHEQLDIGVLAARDGIALVENLRAGRADGRTRDHAHHALVEPFDRDALVVGAPPIAGQATHFFLRDEFRFAPAHVLVRF